MKENILYRMGMMKVHEPPKTPNFIRVPLITDEEIEELKDDNLPKERRRLLEELKAIEDLIVNNEKVK